MYQNRIKYLFNFLSISSAQIISNLITFISFSIIARHLGVDNFGIFSYYLSLTFILTKLTDFGFAPIVFRELSKNYYDYKLLNVSINIRLISFLVLLFISNILLIFFKTSNSILMIFNFLMFSALISYKSLHIRELIDIPFKVHYTTYYSSLMVFIENILLLLGVLFIRKFNYGIISFSFLYFIVSVPSLFVLVYLLYKRYEYKYNFQFNNIRELFKLSLPIFLCVISENISQQLDVMLLKFYYTNYEVGIYSALIRLVFPFLFIATAYVNNIFPVLSREEKRTKLGNIDIVSFSIKLLIIISVFITVLLFAKSDEIVHIVYGDKYISGSNALKILSISIIPLFYNFYLINLIIAKNSQKYINYYSLILVFTNLIFNLILLHFFSYYATSIVRALTLFAGFMYLRYIAYKLDFNIKIGTLKIIFFTLLFLIISQIISSSIPILFFIFIYLFLGITLIFILRVINKEEIILLMSLFKRKK